MTINSINGITGNTAAQNSQRINERLQTTIASIVTGTRQVRDDVASLSVATQLQTEVTALREVSGNVAQNVSLLQVADGGAEQIGRLTEELRNLATQAQSPTITDEIRSSLNEQFQQLSAEIDRIAQNTNFNDQPLLNGNLTGDNALSVDDVFAGENDGSGAEVAINDLSSDALFSGQALDISTAEGAAQAVATLSAALDTVSATRTDIGAFQQTLGFVAANVDAAIANQEAARSVLADTDIAEESTILALLNAQRESNLAVTAQANRLPEGLLRLVE